MPRTVICMLTRPRTVNSNRIGGCCALLVALACCPAIGQQRTNVKTAFRDNVDERSQAPTETTLPSPPEAHWRPPGSIKNDPSYQANQGAESIPMPGTNSQGSTYYEPQYVEYSYPNNGFSRLPVVGRLQRRWVTHTKPWLQATHWGYPEYFDERPFGTDVLQAEQMQIVNGLRDQQVLYDYDFLTGDQSDTLSPRGEYQLRKIIKRMEIVPTPIIIQTAITDPKLDEARRQHVLDALQVGRCPCDPGNRGRRSSAAAGSARPRGNIDL